MVGEVDCRPRNHFKLNEIEKIQIFGKVNALYTAINSNLAC